MKTSSLGSPINIGDTVYRYHLFTTSIDSFILKDTEMDYFRCEFEYYTVEEYWSIRQYDKKDCILNSKHELEFVRFTALDRLRELV